MESVGAENHYCTCTIFCFVKFKFQSANKWSLSINFAFKEKDFMTKCTWVWGSGCGSVGRAVASDTRCLRFVTLFYIEHLVYCQLQVMKRQNMKKWGWDCPILKIIRSQSQTLEAQVLYLQHSRYGCYDSLPTYLVTFHSNNPSSNTFDNLIFYLC